jgi:sodium-dependent dicarboxylate transporter 2/3/5
MSFYGWDAKACWTGTVVMLCVIWWIFEPVPIPVTSLIPLAVFPLVGVLPKEEIAKAYGNDMILLMLGGFMISAAMAHSGTHHRLALGLIR